MSAKPELQSQIKFYFSHVNYNKDIFLREECEKKINDETRGIPISTLLIFSKMKAHKATEQDIIDCVLSDELKDIIKIRTDSEGNKFLLKNDLDEYAEYKKRISVNPDSFIIRVSGVSGELEEVRSYISQFMKPLLIRMRKDKRNKKYTGTCFIELGSPEEVEEAIAMKIPVMLKTKENNDPKRNKKETEYMQILKKKDYIEQPKATPEEKHRQLLLQKNKGKFYSFETNTIQVSSKSEDENEKKKESLEKIKLIKNKIGAQFVDLKNKILRFKDIQNFESKEIEGFKLKKLSCEEEKEYIAKIPVKAKEFNKDK
ncbi:La like protein [Cucumispora dikerogammari]|nr:La like protein [Cucumispora dikerogammari]